MYNYNTVDLGYYKCILELKLGWAIPVMFCWGEVGLTRFSTISECDLNSALDHVR